MALVIAMVIVPSFSVLAADSPEVTIQNYVRAETDLQMRTYVEKMDAFWSVTAYDSTTGRLHANDKNRYHINNTTAIKDDNGTYTFRFKVSCEDGDQNCLEVPAGPFDVAARYYLPASEVMSGKWKMPRPAMVKND